MTRALEHLITTTAALYRPRWHRTADRLPEVGQVVVARWPTGHHPLVARRDEDCWWTWQSCVCGSKWTSRNDPAAWCELP